MRAAPISQIRERLGESPVVSRSTTQNDASSSSTRSASDTVSATQPPRQASRASSRTKSSSSECAMPSGTCRSAKSARAASSTGTAPRRSSTSSTSRSAASSRSCMSGAYANVCSYAMPKGRPLLRPPGPAKPGRLALDGRLQLTACRELRHGGRGDLNPLARARVHALPGGAGRSRELAEPREVDVTAVFERVGDRLEKRVDGLLTVPGRETALLRHDVDEFLLRHGSSYLDCRGPGVPDPNKRLNHALWRSILGARQDVRGGEEAPEADGVPRELVHAPLLAVDDADRLRANEAGFAEGLDRRDGRAARRHDVLHEAHLLAGFEHAFEAIVGAVALRVLADD